MPKLAKKAIRYGLTYGRTDRPTLIKKSFAFNKTVIVKSKILISKEIDFGIISHIYNTKVERCLSVRPSVP